MEHAELSSSVIFVCHVNFSRRLEAESAAISVLFDKCLTGHINKRKEFLNPRDQTIKELNVKKQRK